MNSKIFVDHVNSRRRGKMSDLELRAANIAYEAHVGQTRKFDLEPYICHPAEVASIVSQVTNDPDVLAAAWLHDVVEDCEIPLGALETLFNAQVATYVRDLSSPDTFDAELKKRPRHERHIATLHHLAAAHPNSKTVKLADILSNINSLVYNDPSFARVWVKEKAEILPYLKEGEIELYMLVRNNIANSKEYLRI